jgi:pimeloyl-ACP methyl ester carboxylesterase
MKTLALSFALACALAAQQPFQVKVAGKGKPMVLIPGLSSSGETWDTTVERYKDRFECHVITVAGFAGVPRVPAPMLERVRDGLAEYVRAHKLDRPVIVGHSLGGYVALSFAAKYPGVAGRLVIVDAYPFFVGISDPAMTPAKVAEMVSGMRQYYGSQTQDMYEGYVRSGAGTRTMVDKESDFKRIVQWGLASDRTAVADAMAELFSGDLRQDVAKIRIPVLVLGSWIGYAQYTDRKRTEANLRTQYAALEGVEIQITDKAHHFIMWDDPEWMFGTMDRFLASVKPPAAR